MNYRYVFSNIEHWGSMTGKIYRNDFKKFFDWFSFNFQVLMQYCGKEMIAVFDPSYIKKGSKQTYGPGMFWNSVSQRSLKGTEVGCLALVDVAANTALRNEAVQTPLPKKH